MPVTIKMNKMHLKKDDGTYIGINTVAERTTEEMKEEIEDKGEEVLESIPEDYQEMTRKMIVSKETIGSSSTVPRDADTLGGHSESYFATNDDLSQTNRCIGKAKNLLNAILQTTTKNGVTCTNNGDGTYTLNGTASATTLFELEERSKKYNGNSYRLVGCPSGGSDTTYILYLRAETTTDYKDYGNGNTFTVENNTDKRSISIRVLSGVVCNNLVFKPMLTTDTTTTYDDFAPYTGSGKTLAEDVSGINNNLAQLGKYEKNELVLVGKWGNKNLYRVNIDGDTGSKVNDWNVVYTAPTGKLIVRYELYMEIGNDYWTVNNIFDGVNFVYTAYRNNNTEIATCPSSSRINKQLYGVVWLCDN